MIKKKAFFQIALTLMTMLLTAHGLKCFWCYSEDSSDPNCETGHVFSEEKTCTQEDASCIRLIGTFRDSKKPFMYRGCLESGADKLVQEARCGEIMMSGRMADGCSQLCHDHLCN